MKEDNNGRKKSIFIIKYLRAIYVIFIHGRNARKIRSVGRHSLKIENIAERTEGEEIISPDQPALKPGCAGSARG